MAGSTRQALSGAGYVGVTQNTNLAAGEAVRPEGEGRCREPA